MDVARPSPIHPLCLSFPWYPYYLYGLKHRHLGTIPLVLQAIPFCVMEGRQVILPIVDDDDDSQPDVPLEPEQPEQPDVPLAPEQPEPEGEQSEQDGQDDDVDDDMSETSSYAESSHYDDLEYTVRERRDSDTDEFAYDVLEDSDSDLQEEWTTQKKTMGEYILVDDDGESEWVDYLEYARLRFRWGGIGW